MYVNRSAIVNHDIIVAIYIIRLAPINRLGEFLIFHSSWKKSFEDGSSKRGGGPVGVGVVEFYTSTRHHVHAFFRFNDEDRCLRSSFFTFPFCLSLSRRECAPRYAVPIGRLLLLLPHRRESGHTVSFVHQVSSEKKL